MLSRHAYECLDKAPYGCRFSRISRPRRAGRWRGVRCRDVVDGLTRERSILRKAKEKKNQADDVGRAQGRPAASARVVQESRTTHSSGRSLDLSRQTPCSCENRGREERLEDLTCLCLGAPFRGIYVTLLLIGERERQELPRECPPG